MDLTRYQTRAAVLIFLIATSLILAAAAASASFLDELPENDRVTNKIIRLAPATTVNTTSGFLVGLESQPNHAGYQSVIKYLGVPYAQAPIGPLRFKRPVELVSSQTVNATTFAKTCPQHRHLTRFISPLLNLDRDHQISEDCLRLNIFVPITTNGRTEGSLPVIVWIPGEGFDFADARQFDGSQLALKTRSIVVTVQYRVGVLGLLDMPELGIEGNQAIHDQLMALKWVQKNIRAFGGDRDLVTVVGRFSGGMSISAMLTAPNKELVMRAREGEISFLNKEKALFSRAIMLSGIAVDDWIIVDSQQDKVDRLLEDAYKQGFCANKGHNSALDCLQSMPVNQLLAISGYQWRLVRDDQLISRKGGPIKALRSRVAPLPGVEAILLGETAAEGTLCLYRHMLTDHLTRRYDIIESNRLTNEDLNDYIRDDLKTYFRYNTSMSNQALEVALSALTDTQDVAMNSASSQLRQKYLDACSNYMVRSHNSRFKRHLPESLQLYHYQLNYKPSFSLAPDYIKTAAHGDDIPLLFGLVYNQPARELDPADLAMTQKMHAYIGNFIRGRTPQGGDERRARLLSKEQQSAVHTFDLSSEELAQGETGSLDRTPTINGQVAKLIVIESSQMSEQQQLQQQQRVAEGIRQQQQQQQQAANDESLNGQLTRSQKLLEIHRQQSLDEGLWVQRRAQLLNLANMQSGAAASGQHITTTTTSNTPAESNQLSASATETSLATVLLLTASIVILALVSVCAVLSVLVVRYNSLNNYQDIAGGPMGANRKRAQHFSSSSSCNICDDSPSGGTHIDAVLNHQASTKKNEHAFCNVFAKLRNHQPHSQASAVRPTSNGVTTGGEQQVPAAGRPMRNASSGQHVVESLTGSPTLAHQ